jgi:hypothetical protein
MPEATARLGDNPTKTDLSGVERIAGTDPDTDEDFCVTPDILSQFVQENMALASGTSQGAMSGAQAEKLNALYTRSELDAIIGQLGQFPFPVFIGTVVDGFIEIYRNVLDESVVFDFMYFQMSSGSTLLTVKIDGVAVTGWTGVPISTASGAATATAAKTIAPGGVLGLEFSGSGGTPSNLRLTLKGDIDL